MKFRLTFLFIFAFLLNNNFAQPDVPIYKKVEITINDDSDIQKIAESGIDLMCGTHMEERAGTRFLRLDLSEYEYEAIQQKNLTTNVLIEDLSRHHATQNVAALPAAIAQLERAKAESALKSANADPCEDREIPVPQNFNLGSMGGFTTYDELLADLDKMATMYPNLITAKAPIDETIVTHEGRQIFYVKVSDNPNVDEDEAEVLYNGVHHAREPLSMINLQYYLWVLLENYGTDEYITNIVDNTELYFVPVLNPDGYLLNEATDPNGGGYWRKNLRDNGDGTIGVDLNRNYSYAWGQDNQGSSPNPNSNTYRGTAPFSEPETQAIRNFVLSRNFTMAFNNHTYSNLLLSPWGHIPDDTPDHDFFEKIGEEMCKHNRYAYGGGNQLLYSTNGGSDDWYYGENDIPAWTPEIGRDQEGGFWPLPGFIQLQAHRQLRMSFRLAEAAANFGKLHDLTPYALSQADARLTFGVQHISKVSGNLMVSVASDSPYVQNIATTFITTAAAMQGTDFEELSTAISIDPNTPDGALIDFSVTLNNGIRDLQTMTITKEYNAPIVFADDCSSLDNWLTSWAVLDTDGYKGTGCITDSPTGNLVSGESNLVFSEAIDLTDVNHPILEYYAKWDLTKFFNYVQVQISTDNAVTWQDLCAENTKPGMFGLSSFVGTISQQPAADPVYDGVQRDWLREQIDLSAYANTSGVYLRFVIYGDFNQPSSDGFYLDDLTIYDAEAMLVSSENPIDNAAKIQVFPNPTNTDITIDWQQATIGTLNIFDKTGRLIFTQNISQDTDNFTFNSNELPAGIYVIQLESENDVVVKRFVKM